MANVATDEFCVICKIEIMYESSENFDPVCMNDTGDVHCEECCTCGDSCDEPDSVEYKGLKFDCDNCKERN